MSILILMSNLVSEYEVHDIPLCSLIIDDHISVCLLKLSDVL